MPGEDERISFQLDEPVTSALFIEDGETRIQLVGVGEEVEVVTLAPSNSSSSSRKGSFLRARSLHQTKHPSSMSAGRTKAAPALLRNSRKLQLQQAQAQQQELREAQQAAASTSAAASSYGKEEGLGRGQLQHAILLDEHGQPTNEIVVLAPNEAGEYSIVERTTKEGMQGLEGMQMQGGSSVEVAQFQQEGEQSSQTIIICQEGEGTQQIHMLEDMDGNLIPLEGNMQIQVDEATGTLYLEEGGYEQPPPDAPAAAPTKGKGGSGGRKAKQQKKPLQVVVGPDGNPIKKRGQTELKCMEKGCSTSACNVGELRKHLMVRHSLHFDEEVIQFPNEEEFKNWRETYERERMVSFIYRGGTKRVAKDQAVTYLICHRSGHYKPTMSDESQRKRKIKPQGSCKMGGYCTAGIKVIKNVETGVVRVEICHTHYGHPLDSDAIPHLRVTPTLRKVILTKFMSGLSFPEVLAYIHHNPDRLEGLRLVDRRAVRNIYDTWKTPTRRSKQVQKEIDELVAEYPDGFPAKSKRGTRSGGVRVKAEPVESEEGDLDETESFPEDAAVPEREITSESLTENHQENNLPSLVHVSNGTERTEENSSATSTPNLSPTRRRTRKRSEQVAISQPEETKKCNTRRRRKEAVLDVTQSPYSLRPKKTLVEEVHKPTKTRRMTQTERKVVEEEEEEEAQNMDLESDAEIDEETVDEPKPKKSKISAVKSGRVEPKKRKSRKRTSSGVKKKDAYSLELEEEADAVDAGTAGSLEESIEKLTEHGDSGPTVLLYKPFGEPTKLGETRRELKRDEFCAVLQSPVQRQLLLMFPNVVGFDVIETTKDSEENLQLAFLMVLDEFKEPIPVAWLLAKTLEPRILTAFFKSLKKECGDLKVKYLMAPKASEAYNSWTTVFTESPLNVLNDFEVRRELKALVWNEFSTEKGRREVWEVVEGLITERQPENLDISSLEEKFEPLLDKLPHTGEFIEKLEKQWLSRVKDWAHCYRFGASVNIMGASHAFNKLRKFIHFKGTKNLDENFDQILKIGYDKCFLRSKRLFKGDQKLNKYLEAIWECHRKTQALKNQEVKVTPVMDDTWLLNLGENLNVVVSHVGSPCGCKLICKYCRVCQHMYTCTCQDYMVNNLMCEHIHYTHCDRLQIELDPAEFISGDVVDAEESDVFGRIETLGTEEGPGAVINIEAVLKAAGLFQKPDGLQPEQIVSITDADTQTVIYESTAPSVSGSVGGAGELILQASDLIGDHEIHVVEIDQSDILSIQQEPVDVSTTSERNDEDHNLQ